jgi:hypothetical protein
MAPFGKQRAALFEDKDRRGDECHDQRNDTNPKKCPAAGMKKVKRRIAARLCRSALTGKGYARQ